jgi:PhoH-like ATPase
LNNITVIDTNVIIEDPSIIEKIMDCICIPTTVLKELDKKKYDGGIKGYNIRQFSRSIEKNPTNILFFDSEKFSGSPDDRIIEAACQLSRDNNVTVLSNDLLMGMLAKAQGIRVKRHELIVENDCYSGIKYGEECEFPNEYLIDNSGIHRLHKNGYERLGKDKKVWGIKHKNAEQKCALDALLDDEIKLVTISGKAGTGKTLLAIAAGLEKTVNHQKYDILLVSRPVVPMGHDMGYLPGDINEKLSPWMQPIFDNIDYLFNNSKDQRQKDNWKSLEEQGLLKLEPLTYIRGRSIPYQYIIVDEAQNLTPHETKTIISRAGEGTKIILTGDPDQIDNPKLNCKNNGLTYVVDRFKKYDIAAHIKLVKGERSQLADLAAEIL